MIARLCSEWKALRAMPASRISTGMPRVAAAFTTTTASAPIGFSEPPKHVLARGERGQHGELFRPRQADQYEDARTIRWYRQRAF
jgi:hypothetical protein